MIPNYSLFIDKVRFQNDTNYRTFIYSKLGEIVNDTNDTSRIIINVKNYNKTNE